MKQGIIQQNGKVHLRTEQDVTDLLKENAEMRKINQTGEVRKIASIPAVMIPMLKDDYGIDLYAMNDDMKKRLMILLNSPSFQNLKTINGKV